MTSPLIPAHRLENQRISQSEFQTPAEVVGWMGAIQGQDYASVEWSIGLRLPGSTQAMVDQALDDGSIVRTWMLRGTLHMVAGADVHWMLGLLAPKMIAGNARRYKELELDEPTMLRANELLERMLNDGETPPPDPLSNALERGKNAEDRQGGKIFSRAELFAMLEANGISTKGQRGVYLLQRAAFDGLLSRGVTRGGDDVFMGLKAVPGKNFARDEALAELARRYFQSHGPATFADFVWWTGLKTGDARAGFEAVKSEFVAETVEGETYWLPEHLPHPQPLSHQGRGVKMRESDDVPIAGLTYLLPGFDEYVLGYKDRGAVLDTQYANLICPGGNGVFYPTIVRDGQVVGTWKRAFKKGKVVMTPTPFGDHEIGNFEGAAQKFAAFVGMAAEVDE